MFISTIFRIISDFMARRETANQLRQLTNRDLEDIGITRSMIDDVAASRSVSLAL